MQKTTAPFKAIIATITLTGKAGKSVMANNLLLPRMPGAKLFRMETFNESGAAGNNAVIENMKGRELEKLLKGLGKVDSAVVDIGTSNVENFLLGLAQDGGAQNIFDYFVVPVESNSAKINEFKEFVKIVNTLKDLGVQPDRIKVVFNKHLPDNEIKSEMARVFNYHASFPIFSINERAVIHETELFKALGAAKKSYEEMLLDNNDYYKMLKETPLDKTIERETIIRMARAQGLVRGIDIELNSVFSELFGLKKAPSAKTTEFSIADSTIDVSDFE